MKLVSMIADMVDMVTSPPVIETADGFRAITSRDTARLRDDNATSTPTCSKRGIPTARNKIL